jgi:hypothetical protein
MRAQRFVWWFLAALQGERLCVQFLKQRGSSASETIVANLIRP